MGGFDEFSKHARWAFHPLDPCRRSRSMDVGVDSIYAHCHFRGIVVDVWYFSRALDRAAAPGGDGRMGPGARFRFRTNSQTLPAPLDAVRNRRLAVQTRLVSRNATLAVVESAPIGAAVNPLRTHRNRCWHFLILDIKTIGPPPACDRWRQSPARLTCIRFRVFHCSADLSDSFSTAPTRERPRRCRAVGGGLLPADVGLLLYGPRLVLDFSGRPFDTIEFERMIVVAKQIVDHLPLPDSIK